MAELLTIAREVRKIFGDECRLLNVVSTHEDVGQGADGDLDRASEGISDDEINREVDRIVNPRKSDDDGMSSPRPGGKRWINVTEATQFDVISEVVRVRYEPTAHRALSARVRRSAATLRQYLERLGLHLQPERLRLRGRRVDAPRTRALVTRGDPRVLIAREIQVKTDLFIGVVIDCSGSMAGGENMPRARLFGALIAEAARGMPGVDVRLFGFTDRVIYDAGNALHPAVHALEAGGGNNDSGALWHAANVARASRRKARLLVMISDGMPTECSAASLKHLARELTVRHRMCCAQIAVQPLPEVLFPHYVECDGPDTDAVVRTFGRIIEGLVKRAMGIPS
jgi:Mg-chelatase subunit ChlD